MKLGDILVCLDPTDAGEHRLHLAATLAREHQAHLSAAYILTESIAGVAPYGGNVGAVGRRVLIAWDATREATRALHDALPLLGKAEAVTVMTVRAREAHFERDRPGLDRIVRHLKRHGIAAHAEETLQG